MATDIEICSAALVLLGASPIASLTEGTKQSTLCALLYPPAKREMLRKHVWNCAVKRVVLAPLDGAPTYGWSNWFSKPGDFIRLLDIGECGDDDYTFEGNRILANQTSLRLRYVAEITEGMWDSSMVDVMIKRMAADLAYPVTKSASLAQLKAQEHMAALREAKAIDGQETPPEEFGDSPFIQARSRGSY